MPRKRKSSPAPAPTAPAPVVANLATKQFHIRAFASGSCQIPEIQDAQEFASVDAAIEAQFEGCGFCLAHVDQRTDDQAAAGETETASQD